MIYLLPVLLFFVTCGQPLKIAPLAKEGILDLQDWNLRQDGNLPLQGEWDFYWAETLSMDEIGVRKSCSTDTSRIREDSQIIQVPAQWNGTLYKKKSTEGGVSLQTVPVTGFATYHLKILSSEQGIFSLKM